MHHDFFKKYDETLFKTHADEILCAYIFHIEKQFYNQYKYQQICFPQNTSEVSDFLLSFTVILFDCMTEDRLILKKLLFHIQKSPFKNLKISPVYFSFFHRFFKHVRLTPGHIQLKLKEPSGAPFHLLSTMAYHALQPFLNPLCFEKLYASIFLWRWFTLWLEDTSLNFEKTVTLIHQDLEYFLSFCTLSPRHQDLREQEGIHENLGSL